MTPLLYGGVPVPYTVSWTGEEAFRVDRCPHAGVPAFCQADAPGVGRPRFGRPHYQRQREAVARDLCDLCGRPLRNRTKVSLSHARPQVGATGLCIMQVEPLLHRECAAVSVRHCPSLKADIRSGRLNVRQVRRSQAQVAFIAPEFAGQYVPGYVARPDERIAGHAKVVLLAWADRDEAWLTREGATP